MCGQPARKHTKLAEDMVPMAGTMSATRLGINTAACEDGELHKLTP